MSARRASAGFTLIELMIAVTIGLVLTLVIGQVFLGSRFAYTSNDALSRVQENARYALTLLSREVRQSTFKSDPRQARATVFPIATTASLAAIDGAALASGTATTPDIITVRFQGSGNGAGSPDGTVQDCTGTRIDYGAMVVNTLFIQNDPTNNNEPTLFCFTGAPPANAAPACNANPLPANCFALIPGVENMQMLFGEDTGFGTLNPDGAIDRWVTATNVSNWDNVLGVRIALLLRTDDRVGQQVDTRTYLMSGTNVPAPGNDMRQRRVFTTVINLRNRVT